MSTLDIVIRIICSGCIFIAFATKIYELWKNDLLR